MTISPRMVILLGVLGVILTLGIMYKVADTRADYLEQKLQTVDSEVKKANTNYTLLKDEMDRLTLVQVDQSNNRAKKETEIIKIKEETRVIEALKDNPSGAELIINKSFNEFTSELSEVTK